MFETFGLIIVKVLVGRIIKELYDIATPKLKQWLRGIKGKRIGDKSENPEDTQ